MMKILDVDMDYFVKHNYSESIDNSNERLPDKEFADKVWTEQEVRTFLEKNLGLSKAKRIPGRLVTHHNEALFFWEEQVRAGNLIAPFEVIHIDSHADLGLNYNGALGHITKNLLPKPVIERPRYSEYESSGEKRIEGIGDYLLFAIAYRMISSLTYCGNPLKQCNDFPWTIIQYGKETDVVVNGGPVESAILLLHSDKRFPSISGTNDPISRSKYQEYLKSCTSDEPIVPFHIIPRIVDVHYDGDFDYAVLAQSPNYTPASADYIMKVFEEYIDVI